MGRDSPKGIVLMKQLKKLYYLLPPNTFSTHILIDFLFQYTAIKTLLMGFRLVEVNIHFLIIS